MALTASGIGLRSLVGKELCFFIWLRLSSLEYGIGCPAGFATITFRTSTGEYIAVPRIWNSAMSFFCQLHMERVTLQSTVFGGFYNVVVM